LSASGRGQRPLRTPSLARIALGTLLVQIAGIAIGPVETMVDSGGGRFMKAVTGAQMREIDRRAEAGYGIRSLLLMENAALRVVEAAEEMLRAGGGRRVAVVAGKGNNGGDGLAAARHLFGRGWDVTVWLVADPESVQGDARVNLEIVR